MTSGERYPEVLAALELLFPPGRVIEVRVLGDDGVSSGYFDDYPAAATEILVRDADPRVSGIYVTLNEVRPDLLGRRANRIKFRLTKKDATTADADIIRRRWLPIDIDPVRPSGISSSEPEHADALDLAGSIARFLTGLGWPLPVIADSGNGAHLLYPLDLPNDEESRLLIQRVLEILDMRFSNTRCKVDTANFNAARIWKVYGTVSRKGDSLAERPHRRSRIISVPEKIGNISVDQMQALLSRYPSLGDLNPEERGTQSMMSTRDLGSWLSKYHLPFNSKPYQGGTLFVLDSCPFSDAHTDGAFAIQFPNGAIYAGCHHNSCGSGRQRWPELRARFETKTDVENRLARMRTARIRGKAEAEGRVQTASPDKESTAISSNNSPCLLPDHLDDPAENTGDRSENPSVDPIKERSLRILTQGDPLSFLLETFAQTHEGDREVAECMVHSLISRSVINSKGLHVSITGESGKGKSHAIDTMRSLVPEQFRLEGRMSDKALFYMEDLRPGTVITLDDVSLSDQMQEILKGVTTSFQKPFPYRTVNKDRKAQTCMIPERCVWWIAKVEGAGDDQVFNRMLTCWIDDSEEQDQKVLDRTLASAGQIPVSLAQVSEEVKVCRQIWMDITPVWVVIPYARRIRFQSAENRRNPDMLLDLIRTNAAIRQWQREMVVENGVSYVVAGREDFCEAARLFVALNGDTGAQGNKLTKREAALIDAIASLDLLEVTVAELQRVTGWANSSISKLLHGYRSYGKSYSGLLEKCSALSFLDRTVTRGDDGFTTLRRARVYLWDPELYAAWVKGGSVWLADDPGDQHTPPGSPDDGTAGDAGDARDAWVDLKDPESLCDEDPHEETGMSTRVDPDDQDGDRQMFPDSPDEDIATGDNYGDHGSDHDYPGSFQADAPPETGISAHVVSDSHIGKEKIDSMKVPGGIPFASVDPHDYSLIDGILDRQRCSVCGKRPAQYQERMRNKRILEQPFPHRLCASCYHRAVSRTVASIIPLPGIIKPERMIRARSSIGRCHLCDLRSATWSDPNLRINLCDACYQREALKVKHAPLAQESGSRPP